MHGPMNVKSDKRAATVEWVAEEWMNGLVSEPGGRCVCKYFQNKSVNSSFSEQDRNGMLTEWYLEQRPTRHYFWT